MRLVPQSKISTKEVRRKAKIKAKGDENKSDSGSIEAAVEAPGPTPEEARQSMMEGWTESEHAVRPRRRRRRRENEQEEKKKKSLDASTDEFGSGRLESETDGGSVLDMPS